MKIYDIPLSQIIPYENNPRINDGAVAAVKKSIQEFGFKVPMVIDKDYTIVTGHTRYKAAKELGLKTVPCILADDLTEEQVKAFRLADNKTGELAQWDFDKLEKELEGLDGLHSQLETIGFEFTDDFNLEDFFRPVPTQEPEPEREPAEEPPFEVPETEPEESAEAQEPFVETPVEALEGTENASQLVCPYCGHILELGDLNG